MAARTAADEENWCGELRRLLRTAWCNGVAGNGWRIEVAGDERLGCTGG